MQDFSVENLIFHTQDLCLCTLDTNLVCQKMCAEMRINMSVVIVGGHDRMVCRYKKICKEHNCKAKVFTQMSARLSEQIGSPDLLILFTNTVSHSMTCCALQEAKKCGTCVARIHTSSANALHEILKEHCNSCSENGECACLKNA